MALGGEFFSFRPRVVASVLEAMNQAYVMQETEIDAALKIQSAYRMWRVRCVYCTLRSAVICVQRVYRGHVERMRVLRIRREADAAHEKSVYEYYATRIQACFRGYYVRSYVDNFYARMRYIRDTLRASEDVREMCSQLLEEQLQQSSMARSTQLKKEYTEATAKLHHLVSTVGISGIYRPPMSASALQTVYGTNVENDIRRHTSEVRRSDLLKSVTENVKSASVSTRNDGTTTLPTTHHTALRRSQGVVGDTKDEDPKKETHFIRFAAQRGAWNRSRVEGYSILPPITDTSVGKQRNVLRTVVHSCLDDFTPLYDTGAAELERCVNAKEMQALHGNKVFVVPAVRRVPS